MSGLTLKPVRWKSGHFNRHRATIGTVVIGGVSWKMLRDQKDWQASAALTNERNAFDSLDDAKRWVESRALAFVESLARPSSPGGTET